MVDYMAKNTISTWTLGRQEHDWVAESLRKNESFSINLFPVKSISDQFLRKFTQFVNKANFPDLSCLPDFSFLLTWSRFGDYFFLISLDQISKTNPLCSLAYLIFGFAIWQIRFWFTIAPVVSKKKYSGWLEVV